jgi:outer membrane protein TolC
VEGAGPSGRPRLAGSLSLEQALQVALAGNLRLAMARTELDASRAEVLAVAARKGPQLSLGAVLATGDFDMIYPGAPGVMPQFLARLPGDQVLDVNAMVMVPLFTGGQLSAALEAARQAEKAAVARVAFSQRETARKVRAAYWMVLLAGQELEVARWRLAEQQEMLRLAREQLEAGRVARFVVLRAEAEEAMARQELNSARAALVEAEGELKMAMGVDVTSSLACSDPFAAPPAPGPEEQDMKTALRERPDLVAARHGVEEGARRVDEARAAYSPRLYATGMYEGTKIRPFGAGEFMDGFHAGLVLGWQVYDSGERAGMVQAAEAEKRRREIEVQELELEVTRQVQVARARLTAALENLELSRAEVAQAEEDLRIARLRFQVGRGIHLEILDAVATLARARLNAARAGYAANLAWADLLFATGRY